MENNLKKRIIDLEFILEFALEDFKTKYAGSVLGLAWAFLQPLITILLYWFIFQLGFKSQPIANFPFILWLVSGLIPWFFISDSISNATGCLIEYSYLVKKVLFNIDILPVVKVVSSLMVQIFLLVCTVFLFALNGFFPDVYYFQIFFFLIYMVILVCGIVYVSATLYVFFKDTLQIINVILQIFFWATPIVWDFEIMPPIIQEILRFNPLYYIIEGYRNTFIKKIWFWEMGNTGLYYWFIALVILFLGRFVFYKCKIHFADIL